jgi:hypothetical protein
LMMTLMMIMMTEKSKIWCIKSYINPLNAELNPICHLLTLLGAHHILHVSRVRVKGGTCYKKIPMSLFRDAGKRFCIRVDRNVWKRLSVSFVFVTRDTLPLSC